MDGFDLPMGFGKAAKQHDPSAKIAQTKRVAEAEAPAVKSEEPQLEDGRHIEGEATSSARDDDDELPISHQIVLSSHTRAVSALGLDPSGTRIASGGYDYLVKLWDFGGMNADMHAFRSFEAKEGHQVKELAWSTTGDGFLCVNGSNRPQIFDRDGSLVAEYNKGDMYIRDMRHCDGHVAEISSAAWHPTDPATFITAAADSTLRIWNADDKRKSKAVIVVKSKQPGTRTKVTACAYSPDGKTIAAACQDGTLHLWAASSNFARPNATVEGAHVKDSYTSSICFTKDGKTLFSRGGDDTLKAWNTKAFKKPVAVRQGLISLNPETNVVLSPDERHVLTGVAADKAAGLDGRVIVMAKDTLEITHTIPISSSNVIRVVWHPRINQILTGSSSGEIHVLFSPLRSTKGATLPLARAPKQRRADDADLAADVDQPIFTPHALPMFRDEGPAGGQGGEEVAANGRAGKRKRERERQDPKASMKPTPPLTGPGKGGRVGASATQHVIQGLVKDSIRHEDPREALLKYAKQHEGEATEWTRAWDGNQVVMDARLLDDETREEEDRLKREEERKRLKREKPPTVS